jgi:hypothetical protein
MNANKKTAEANAIDVEAPDTLEETAKLLDPGHPNALLPIKLHRRKNPVHIAMIANPSIM